MSFIDDQIDDFLMNEAYGYDEDDGYPEYDDRFLTHPDCRMTGGIDWRKEKGGILYDD